jgi:23S rRNA pseudouridine1911/1915/1917 synthase
MNAGWTYTNRIGADTSGQTALAFYATRYRHSSEAVWRERMARGEIIRRGKPAAPDDRLTAGDVLVWRRPPWEEPPVPTAIPVLYEDESVLVVDKPAGLPVLPDGGYLENTLVFLLRGHAAADAPPVPVHRLGRGTSGVIVLARSATVREHLCAQFRRATAEAGRAVLRKSYRALTSAVPGLPDAIEIRQPIGPVPCARLGTVHAASPAGRPACSRCRILARRGGTLLWEIELITGRPHQIRIHLASIGAPLLGDPFYGPGGVPRPDSDALPGDIGYTLRACALRFVHPRTGRPIEIHAPIPPELQPLQP